MGGPTHPLGLAPEREAIIGTANDDKLWRRMLARSFSPQQWYTDRDWPDDPEPYREDAKMWVYRQTEPGVFTVGYFTPTKEWVTDSDHPTKEAAAERVHYLNGGAGDPHGIAEAARRGCRGQ